MSSPEPSAAPKAVYHCGTLTYTRPRLAILFFWLLWGDVCYILMETVMPSLMPLKFKELDASNATIGLLMVTLPMLMNAMLNPVISFKSDRYRSRWGRRVPFILFTAPFLVLSLLGLAYGDALGHWIYEASGPLLAGFSPNSVAIFIIGVMMVLFCLFNVFVNSVFWYLFNDVVPPTLLARFMSWFRMVGLAASSLYSLFIFPMAGTHLREILIGVGLLYLFGFGLMCLNVKEGAYPPPPENVDGGHGLLSSIKTFGQECLSHRIYWFLFLGSAAFTISEASMVFLLFLYQGTGLNLTQIGQIASTFKISTAVLVLVAGWLADRYHPIRIVLVGQLFQILIVLPAWCVWIFWQPPVHLAFWIWIALKLALSGPAAAMIAMLDPTMLMRIFPRSRLGQFSSANALCRSLGAILGGVLAGLFFDQLGRAGITNVYAFIPVWQFVFCLLWFLCTWQVFRQWKACGGDAAYRPPLRGQPENAAEE